MQRAIILLAAVLAVARTAAAGPSAPACYACYCGSANAQPRYCRVIEEQDDYSAAREACGSSCNGSFQFTFVLDGNFCPSPPCANSAAPTMSRRVLVLTALALLSFGALYTRRRPVRR